MGSTKYIIKKNNLNKTVLYKEAYYSTIND